MPRPSPLSFQGSVLWNPETKKKKLVLKNVPYFNHHIQKFDGPVVVRIETQKKVRSLKQNRRYWGAVIEKALEDASNYTGYTPEEMHHIFKVRHLQPKILKDPVTKAEVPVWSTKHLTVGEFQEFGFKVEQDLAEMGIKILTPEQYWKGIA